jgi:plasmid stabilization system protein ParE
MKVVFSRPALADLDEILGYLSERSPLPAEHVEARRRALDHIARHPQAAEEVTQRPGIRRLPIGRYPYVVYFEIVAGEVTVLRILHGARRAPW